ncbi:hypothetical protein NE237_028409 [Protea cynaroides]|uniref:Uncharacterized protein n=1 Tax=Protea cynaroides TaxID=273540 RepID=A0A9Q0GP98_9MAGN|nr:hypothetical protein NE237_028409 [Protea cynaroides]
MDDEVNITMSSIAWEQLYDYEKFKMMVEGVKEDKVVEWLCVIAIPFMQQHRFDALALAFEDQWIDDQHLVVKSERERKAREARRRGSPRSWLGGKERSRRRGGELSVVAFFCHHEQVWSAPGFEEIYGQEASD